ncbi:uncharacterized protein LOC132704781 [Cylas formicarius]|uniref:uncharacterized protein LOC132704781 n=1 Tax=Cylas formicarius TaxID=197179 RepID=UPI0029587DDD|nr:uncharacterized protein LOC132704781 [Cylas formicarius]
MDEILIETVRQHEVLYNHSSRDYRDQRMRQEAWEELDRELKISADKDKQMWDKHRTNVFSFALYGRSKDMQQFSIRCRTYCGCARIRRHSRGRDNSHKFRDRGIPRQ